MSSKGKYLLSNSSHGKLSKALRYIKCSLSSLVTETKLPTRMSQNMEESRNPERNKKLSEPQRARMESAPRNYLLKPPDK